MRRAAASPCERLTPALTIAATSRYSLASARWRITFTLVAMRSSKEATCNTQSSVKSGSPTRPKSSAPKNETFTCWRSESPEGARRLQVLPLSCSSADCSTNGKAALIASRSSGLSEKKSKSTEARCPSRRATAVPPYRTKPRSAAGRSAGHSRCCAGGNISMRGLKTPLTQTSAQARPERDPRWPGRGGNASSPGALIELPGFRVFQDLAQRVITDLNSERLNIGVVAHIHHLGNDPLRHGDSLIWRFPPDVLAGKRLQGFRIHRNHAILRSTHFYDFQQIHYTPQRLSIY